MPDYRRLKVWEKSHQAVLDVYAATSRKMLNGLIARLDKPGGKRTTERKRAA